MKKFSKVVESIEDLTSNIKDIFVDMIDSGLKVNIKKYRSFYIIKIYGDKYSDTLTILNDIIAAIERISTLGLNYITSNVENDVSIGKNVSIFLKYQHGSFDESTNKNVSNWSEFESYCNNVLGIDGIRGDVFKINVATPSGFPGSDEYWGWEIDAGEGEIIDIIGVMIKEFPKYKDFFNKVMRRRLDWSGLWYTDSTPDKNKNPLGFDREGIEIVEKLLEIAKEYPSKIEVIKK